MRHVILILSGALALLVAGPASAALEITWYTIDAGGGMASGGSLVLRGTIGQPEAGSTATAGTLALRGGYWARPIAALCFGDVDGTGVVGFSDVLVIIATWGACPPECPGDLNGDGMVGFQDLLSVIGAWGPCS